ncbi:DUF1345 domain-containing protein [Tumidithrix elongata RA019]|uniref:DUF1345 domain-containing protein n=1 Tax=Tumidithrix elongata BACA0141 TaxID=2716417 RepID=A0AAW9Q4Y1_9CYAN|nr:DUF1345 domain-containing protein [Tumidithrix elongata RA019]
MNPLHRPKLPRHWSVRPRLLISIFVAVVVSVLLPSWFKLSTHLLCMWDAGMVCFLGLTWLLMLKGNPENMRRNAQSQDEGRFVILSLIVAAACASILAIGFVLRDTKGVETGLLILRVTLLGVTIIGSWLLVHTIFAMHYAHEYYQDHKILKDSHAGGLDFPDDIEPDYWDFLYFSFVIGMTSQVSDVAIRSRSLRRLSLFHGILSFFFNTMIVAMSINIVAGLIQS